MSDQRGAKRYERFEGLRGKSPLFAYLLNIVLPGLGTCLYGRPVMGVLLMIIVCLAAFLFFAGGLAALIGIIIVIVSIIGAFFTLGLSLLLLPLGVLMLVLGAGPLLSFLMYAFCLVVAEILVARTADKVRALEENDQFQTRQSYSFQDTNELEQYLTVQSAKAARGWLTAKILVGILLFVGAAIIGGSIVYFRPPILQPFFNLIGDNAQFEVDSSRLAQSPDAQAAIERAKQWAELGEYDNARSELLQAIRLEPSNVAARVIIAETYIDGAGSPRDIGRALEYLIEAEEINSKYPRIREVRRSGYDRLNSYLSSDDSRVQSVALEVAEQHLDRSLLPGLEQALHAIDSTSADTAIRLIEAIDPALARAAMEGLLESDTPMLKRRAAMWLWKRERLESVKPIVRDILFERLVASSSLAIARQITSEIVDTGYNDVEARLLAIAIEATNSHGSHASQQQQRSQEQYELENAGTAAYEILFAANNEEAWRYARDFLSIAINYRPKPRWRSSNDFRISRLLCTDIGVDIIRLFGELPKAENVPPLRGTLGGLFLQNFNGACVDKVLAALAKNEGPSWTDMKAWYGGWSIFDTMIPGRIAMLRTGLNPSQQLGYASREWRLFAPGAHEAESQLTQWVMLVNASSRDRSYFVVEDLKFESADECILTLGVFRQSTGSKLVGVAKFVIEAIGDNNDQPWTITRVIEVKDG